MRTDFAQRGFGAGQLTLEKYVKTLVRKHKITVVTQAQSEFFDAERHSEFAKWGFDASLERHLTLMNIHHYCKLFLTCYALTKEVFTLSLSSCFEKIWVMLHARV